MTSGSRAPHGRPPGWYVDPYGQNSLRLWDGERWAEAVRSRQFSPALRQYPDGGRQVPEDDCEPEDDREVASRSGTAREAVGGKPPQEAGSPAEDMLRNALTRLGLSALFAFSLVLFGAGFALDNDVLRLVALTGALFFGVGTAPLQLSERASLDLRLCVAALVGLSLPAVLASVMVLVPVWLPTLAALLAGAIAVWVHVAACRQVLRGPLGLSVLRSVNPQVRDFLDVSVACGFGGTLLWVAGMAAAGHEAVPGTFGLLPKVPVYWYLGLGLLVAGITLARNKGEWRAAFSTVSLLAALTLTPAVVYGMPRQPAGAKHVDLVQTILQVHSISNDFGIYRAYSGLFSAVAWLCAVSGMHNVMGIANYWPFFIDLLTVVGLRFFFGRLTQSRYRVWLAITLVILVNAVGQDYFSPQSVGFALGVGVYGLALDRQSAGLSERGRTGILLLVGCAMAVTHELSPYLVGGVLAVLVAFRVIRPWYLPATVLVPAVVWALINLNYVSSFISLANFGSLANFFPPSQAGLPSTPGLQRSPLIGEGADALTLGLLVLIVIAVIGLVRNFWNKAAWACIISPGVGLFIIAMDSYGNEGIFRATLFAIPWLAAVSTQALPSVRSRWSSSVYGVIIAGLVGTNLVSSFSLDDFSVIRPADYRALLTYQAVASQNSYLLDLDQAGDILPHNVDTPSVASHSLDWGGLITQAEAAIMNPTVQDAGTIASQYYHFAANNDGETGELYAVWSPAAANYAVDYGFETLAQSKAWRKALIASPDWEVIYHDDGSYLFRVKPGVQ